MGKNAQPSEIGWYYVRLADGKISSRYFDDAGGGCWMWATAWDGFTPNDSFSEWALIPEIHNR